MSHSDRDLILAGIRGARDASGEAHGHTTRTPLAAVGPSRSEDLVEQFMRGARRAGAVVWAESDLDAVRVRVHALAIEERAVSVVVSRDAASAPWRCGDLSTPTGPIRYRIRAGDVAEQDDPVLAAGMGVTGAAYGLADTGTLVVVSSPEQGRLESLVAPVHVALLAATRLLPDLGTLLLRLSAEQRFARHSAVTLITGPSRTADIELTLTIGVHGPRKLHIILLDDRA